MKNHGQVLQQAIVKKNTDFWEAISMLRNIVRWVWEFKRPCSHCITPQITPLIPRVPMDPVAFILQLCSLLRLVCSGWLALIRRPSVSLTRNLRWIFFFKQNKACKFPRTNNLCTLRWASPNLCTLKAEGLFLWHSFETHFSQLRRISWSPIP